jgi:hypothetical protein
MDLATLRGGCEQLRSRAKAAVLNGGGSLGTVVEMKRSPAPVPVRCGGLVRTEARDASDRGARTFVLSFVDLRFDDGHVERWLGPGSVAGFPSGDRALQRLKRWAEDVAEEQLDSLRGEVAMSFVGVERADYDGLPVEVVVEWNHALDLPFDDIAPEPPVD